MFFRRPVLLGSIAGILLAIAMSIFIPRSELQPGDSRLLIGIVGAIFLVPTSIASAYSARLAFRRAANLFGGLVRTVRRRPRIDGRVCAGNDANKRRQKNLLGGRNFISVRRRKSRRGSDHRPSRFLPITFWKSGNTDCRLPRGWNSWSDIWLVFKESKFFS